MKTTASHRSLPLVLGLALVTACSGGGGGGGPSGVFLDTTTSGLDYFSASIAGQTSADGRFRYVQGAQVMFAIGDIVVGLAPGAAIITPVDLVGTATDETDPEVTNIARFLQTLDLDEDPTNGIEIPEAVRTAAVGVFMSFDQDVMDFETNEQAKVDALTAGLPGGSRTLVPVDQARAHLARTLVTVVAGRYDGSYSGDDAGPFHVYVDREGTLYGWAVSPFDGLIGLTGSASTKGGFLAGNVSTGAMFTGQIQPDGSLSGTWELGIESGTFQGTRTVALDLGMDEDLIDMLAGDYSGTSVSNLGTDPFSASFDDDGNVSLPPPDDRIAGTFVSTTATSAAFRALTDEGCEIRGTVHLDGTITGTFENDDTGEQGTFTGTKD